MGFLLNLGLIFTAQAGYTIIVMSNQKTSKWVSEEVFPQSARSETVKTALEFYRKYKEIADITEKIDIAMGRKKIYKYSSGSTKNFKIEPYEIPSTTQSYKGADIKLLREQKIQNLNKTAIL